jgi:hypothetical protein
VDELARHAAALELAEKAEAAVVRRGGHSALTFSPVERLTRYRRAHEKGLTRLKTKGFRPPQERLRQSTRHIRPTWRMPSSNEALGSVSNPYAPRPPA